MKWEIKILMIGGLCVLKIRPDVQNRTEVPSRQERVDKKQ